jgi:hypothetical protein
VCAPPASSLPPPHPRAVSAGLRLHLLRPLRTQKKDGKKIETKKETGKLKRICRPLPPATTTHSEKKHNKKIDTKRKARIFLENMCMRP